MSSSPAPLRPSVVFDCNVLFQAMSRQSGPSAQCLRLLDTNAITLYVSRAILRELQKILDYPELRERNSHLTHDVIHQFFSHLLFRSKFVRDVPHSVNLSRDPEDEPYLDLAASSSAQFIVTRDKDLLDLMYDYSVEAKQFRQRFPTLQIMIPSDFLIAVKAFTQSST